ncbi:hypothetical protein HME9302_00889 [Alteripontixanthobacter maritimus]|uniref:3-demethylubiquinol 3-O-methyltransferase n=1 Tax=Alteripontixanthobacter maritimus TaxID=2161824 RepID=A0A369Q8V8_9SPHN|nr:methyltransferase domain-containing protein [Alteripontixanthobacter maritimus]RDC59697.1 hypothetical protein HME9302_00889 [Alteripontixanthobacter maritimus]
MSDPAIVNYHSNVRHDVLPHVPRGGTLLDLGGGDGATATEVRRQGLADRVGVVDMVEPAPGSKLDFNYQGDLTQDGFIEKIGEEQGPFDTILTLDILEHLEDPWTMVRRLHQQLKPGGVIVSSVPNVRHRSVTVPLLLGNKWQYRDSGILDRTHLRFFVKKTAIELMTSSGLTLESVALLPSGGRIDRTLVKLPIINTFSALQFAIRVRRDD